MGRIREARGAEALSIAAELIGPLSEIASDGDLAGAVKRGLTAGEAAARLLREHGEAVLRLLALDDGITPEEEAETVSPLTLPGRVLGLLRDEAVGALFGSAAAENGGTGSSAASENARG